VTKFSVFLDANVIVSGIVGYGARATAPSILLGLAVEEERFQVVVSDDLVAEVNRALLKPYFAVRVDLEDKWHIMRWFEDHGYFVEIAGIIEQIASHPEDDLILAAAQLGNCEYLVTGDAMLLKLERYGGAEIVSPRAFLAILEENPPLASPADLEDRAGDV
jgi:putative PIN family toxin of toxin-antitoxin system